MDAAHVNAGVHHHRLSLTVSLLSHAHLDVKLCAREMPVENVSASAYAADVSMITNTGK
jgi:hypothetical protein